MCPIFYYIDAPLFTLDNNEVILSIEPDLIIKIICLKISRGGARIPLKRGSQPSSGHHLMVLLNFGKNCMKYELGVCSHLGSVATKCLLLIGWSGNNGGTSRTECRNLYF